MAEIKKVAKDNYLFRDGDPADAMYIIKSGTLAITKTKGNSEVILAEVSTGSMVGEMALFDKKPRSANVKATKDAEVIVLPFDSLTSQMTQLPVWVQAIIKSLSENLRDANKKIKSLESTNPDEERFPPLTLNKLISIFNLVSCKYGKPTPEGGFAVSSNTIRTYTIQIFQEPTNKMQSVVNALCELQFASQTDNGDGSQTINNLKSPELFKFVDWYNEWLFKSEKDRKPALTDADVKIMNGILHFARQVDPNAKGFRKISMTTVQNESMKETGALIKMDDVNPLIEKGYLPEKTMDEKDTYLIIVLEELENPAKHWTIVNELKKKLK